MGRGGIKRVGAGDNRKESARGTLGREKRRRESFPARPRFFFFLISMFCLSFSRFVAVSPLKEPLRRREGRAYFWRGLLSQFYDMLFTRPRPYPASRVSYLIFLGRSKKTLLAGYNETCPLKMIGIVISMMLRSLSARVGAPL